MATSSSGMFSGSVSSSSSSLKRAAHLLHRRQTGFFQPHHEPQRPEHRRQGGEGHVLPALDPGQSPHDLAGTLGEFLFRQTERLTAGT